MITRKIGALLGAAALVGTVLAGATSTVEAAPAQAAATCKITNLAMWSAFNVNCVSARHFNLVSNTQLKYAPWVSKGRTSMQPVCWANTTHYGVQTKV